MKNKQKKQLLFFLDKKKFFIKKFFNERSIAYECTPEDQRKNGFNVLFVEDEKTEFWFDCDNVVYSVIFSAETISKTLVTFNFESYALLIIEGFKLGETSYTGFDDEELNEVNYLFAEKNIMITFTFFEEKLVQLFARYDGYSADEYKKGISLNKFLIRERAKIPKADK